MNQFFTSGGQSTGVSASASVLPMNIQGWFPLGWTGWISLQSKGLSRVFSNTIVQKHQFFGTQLSLWSNSHIQLSHPYMSTGKTVALTRRIFVGKVMSLLFNVLSRLVITYPWNAYVGSCKDFRSYVPGVIDKEPNTYGFQINHKNTLPYFKK